MLSLYSIDKPGVWYNYPLLMPLFRKAGYEVSTKEFMRIGVPFTLAAVLTGYLLVWFLFV